MWSLNKRLIQKIRIGNPIVHNISISISTWHQPLTEISRHTSFLSKMGSRICQDPLPPFIDRHTSFNPKVLTNIRYTDYLELCQIAKGVY